MKLNNKKGISLIVLVITIIVMIVLAAAIILSLQSSGIIGRANEAKSKTDVANAKQVVAMANAEWQLDEAKIRTENNVTTFKEYANKKLTEAGFTIEGNGGISLSDSGAVNTIYVDSKGKQAIIPEGFAVSTVATEKTVEDGLVIKDTKGNEFVWVPVEYIKTNTDSNSNGYDDGFDTVFVTEDGYSNGSLQTFVANGDVTEPYSTDSYTEEVEEYTKMKASVEKNGGFYIARYEAGKGDNNTVVSKKNANVWNYISWGTNMTTIGTDGAVYYSREMYKGSKSVVSTLCYGVQWDAVMNFMSDVPNVLDASKKYIEGSKGMGWYNDNSNYKVHKTGMDIDENASNMVKNVYDMAGNALELTMETYYSEVYSIIQRVVRGGGYGNEGNYESASYRTFYPTGSASDDIVFRPALYLK